MNLHENKSYIIYIIIFVHIFFNLTEDDINGILNTPLSNETLKESNDDWKGLLLLVNSKFFIFLKWVVFSRYETEKPFFKFNSLLLFLLSSI